MLELIKNVVLRLDLIVIPIKRIILSTYNVYRTLTLQHVRTCLVNIMKVVKPYKTRD